MELLLSGGPKQQRMLSKIYEEAAATCTELYVATAYLTSWPVHKPLSKRCRKLLFLVGTDFGITRKSACRDVLKWLPSSFRCDFVAVPRGLGGFHPKVVAWRTAGGRRCCIVGSSNLTDAALSINTEANIYSDMTASQYRELTRWLENMKATAESVNDSWLNAYKERKLKGRGGSGPHPIPVVKLIFPSGKRYDRAIRERRKREKAFAEIARSLRSAVTRCANGKMTNREFWARFWELWSGHESRIMGGAMQILGKSADWKEPCRSLDRILHASGPERDWIVRDEIDRLGKLGIPVRGAWLSEMLCHFFPDQYPLVDRPIKKWLAAQKWRPQRGSTEGARYVQFAKALRSAIRQAKQGPRDMPEADAVAWCWADNNT